MITASNKSSGPRRLPPAGTHLARCYSIVDLGTQETSYQGRQKFSRKVRLSFELPEETAVFDEAKGEQPFAVHSTFTLSLHEKAMLRKTLESWRGKPFTEEELKPGAFDISKVVGTACLVTVVHEQKGENTYANINAITKLPKSMTQPKPVNPPFEFSLETFDQQAFDALPDFLRDTIRKSPEYADLQAPPPEPPEDDEQEHEWEGDNGASEPAGDEIPF